MNVKLTHATEIQSLIKSFIKLVNQQLVTYNNLKCTIEKTTIKHLKDMEDLNSAFHVNNYSVDFNETYHFRIHMFRNINIDNSNNNILLLQIIR